MTEILTLHRCFSDTNDLLSGCVWTKRRWGCWYSPSGRSSFKAVEDRVEKTVTAKPPICMTNESFVSCHLSPGFTATVHLADTKTSRSRTKQTLQNSSQACPLWSCVLPLFHQRRLETQSGKKKTNQVAMSVKYNENVWDAKLLPCVADVSPALSAPGFNATVALPWNLPPATPPTLKYHRYVVLSVFFF